MTHVGADNEESYLPVSFCSVLVYGSESSSINWVAQTLSLDRGQTEILWTIRITVVGHGGKVWQALPSISQTRCVRLVFHSPLLLSFFFPGFSFCLLAVSTFPLSHNLISAELFFLLQPQNIFITMASRVLAPKMATMAASSSTKAARPAFRAAFKPQQATRNYTSEHETLPKLI